MKIEKEQVQLLDIQLQSTPQGGSVTLVHSRRTYQLSGLHFSYLDVLKTVGSIEAVVQFYLGQGWLVNFRELLKLLQFLTEENILRNPSFRHFFNSTARPANLPLTARPLRESSTTQHWEPKDLPFFRSLDPALAKFLLQKSERLHAPAQTRLTHAGQSDRDLFILLQGQAAIYRVLGENQRQMVSILEAGSLFGERGFLLNQPRSADVITTQDSEILRVRHLPEFDQLIKTEKAASLQHRFWVLQALQSSPFFKDLPNASLDSLIFTGRLCQAPTHQVLFHEGQPGNTCYILVQGNVVVSQQGRNINVLKTGSCFGEISLLMSGGRRTATVTTQQDSVLLEIQQNDFYRILGQNLILAKELEVLAEQRLSNDAKRE